MKKYNVVNDFYKVKEFNKYKGRVNRWWLLSEDEKRELINSLFKVGKGVKNV